MFWLDIVYYRCGIIHQSREGRKRKSDESKPTILLVLFCVVCRCCYRMLLFFELWKMTDDHGEDEKIKKPSEDTTDVASISFGNTNKLSNQEIFTLFKMQK